MARTNRELGVFQRRVLNTILRDGPMNPMEIRSALGVSKLNRVRMALSGLWNRGLIHEDYTTGKNSLTPLAADTAVDWSGA